MKPRQAVVKVPRDNSGRRELLVIRPTAWEHLYFASCLAVGLERAEEKWRDFYFGYSMKVGPQLDVYEFVDQQYPNRVKAIVARFDPIIAEPAQRLAFGPSGQPGNAVVSAHVAKRFSESYEQMLDLVDEVLSIRFKDDDENLEGARRAFVEMCTPAIGACREMVGKFIVDIEGLASDLQNGNPPRPVEINLKMDMPQQAMDDFVAYITAAYQAG